MSMPAVDDIFFQIVSGDQVEDAVRDHVAAWMPVYLGEIEVQRNLPRGSLPLPRSYVSSNTFENWGDNQLPGVLVISIGLAGDATKAGDGAYTAKFSVAVATIVSAMDIDATIRLAKQYSAAARAIMVQKPSISGFAVATDWVDESYDDLPGADQRTLASGLSLFEVTVENVVNKQGGPRTWPFVDPPDPETQPGSHWPLVETVDVDVEKEAVE